MVAFIFVGRWQHACMRRPLRKLFSSVPPISKILRSMHPCWIIIMHLIEWSCIHFCRPLARYNSLQDKNLAEFYSRPRIRRHLCEMKLVRHMHAYMLALSRHMWYNTINRLPMMGILWMKQH